MKKKTLKIFTALCLTLTATLGLMGCGSKLPSDPAKLLEASQKKSDEVKSVHGKATMNFEMNLAGETMSTIMDMDMDILMKDMKSKVVTTIDMGPMGSQEVEAYTAKEDDKFYTYTSDGSTWTKTELELAEFEQSFSGYGSSAMLESFTGDVAKSLKLEQTKETSTLTGVITGDEMQKMMDMTGVLGQLGMDASIYENLGDLPIVLVIDNKTLLPTKISMDMTAMMQGIMDSTMGAIEGAEDLGDFTVEIGKCTMDFEYSNYDKVEDFEIPEEAKAA